MLGVGYEVYYELPTVDCKAETAQKCNFRLNRKINIRGYDLFLNNFLFARLSRMVEFERHQRFVKLGNRLRVTGDYWMSNVN